MNALSNQRHPGESHENYRARRRLVATQLKKRLKGDLAYKATEILHLPDAGKDRKVDDAILRGDIVSVQTVTLVNGNVIRVARTKGTTYELPKDSI